jgi:hypothetical protein
VKAHVQQLVVHAAALAGAGARQRHDHGPAAAKTSTVNELASVAMAIYMLCPCY